MEINSSEDQGATMEVDGETSAMDTNDEGLTSGLDMWKTGDISDQSSEPRMTELPTGAELGGMVSQELQQESRSQAWRLPEGVCQKRVVQRGEGLYGPGCGACCTLTLQVSQGTPDLDPSHVGYPLGQSSLQIGEGGTAMSCLLDAALISMKKGETAEVCISRLTTLEGEFMFHVIMHDFTPATPPWRLPPLEKCTSAAAHKEKGAELFKEGNIYGAFAQFRLAIRLLLSILPYSFDDDETTGKSHQQLLSQCYLNLAACQMKSGHHSHVIANCTQALTIDPSSVKALYRRASANVSLGNYLLAQEDLEVGLKQEPHNRALLDLMHSVNSKLAPSESQMAQGLSKMFS